MSSKSEQLSYAPIKINIKKKVEAYTPPMSGIDFLKKYSTPVNFVNLLYSDAERQYLNSKFPNVDCSGKNIVSLLLQFNQNQIQVLEELNAIIIKTDFDKIGDIFQSCKINNVAKTWFDQCETPTAKSLMLNIICACAHSLATYASTICGDIVQSLINSPVSIAKKHFIAIYYIIMKSGIPLEDNVITFTSTPRIGTTQSLLPPSFDQFSYGFIPQPYITSAETAQKYTSNHEEVDFNEKGVVNSTTHNGTGRNILLAISKNLVQFCKISVEIISHTSRLINDKVSLETLYSDSTTEGSTKECDSTAFSVWAALFAIQRCFYASSYFDSELLLHFLARESVISYLVQSIVPTPTALLKSDSQQLIEGCLVMSFNLAAAIVASSPQRVGRYVSEKIIRQVVTNASECEVQSVRSAAALFLSRCSRWMPRQQEGGDYWNFLSFVSINLEQFDLHERWHADKATIPAHLEQAAYVQALQKHCAEIQIDIPGEW